MNAIPITVPQCRPDLGDEEIAAVVQTLRSGWIGTGPMVAQFEGAFAQQCGDGCIAVAVSSATAGLHLALLAHHLPGKRVAVPTWTFTATAHAVELAGARPVFHDVHPHTLNMIIEPQREVCSAYVPVHMAGLTDQETMGDIVIEDAAHCLPYDPGSRTAVFSFYANKPITTGEGGMVVTRSQTIAGRVRRMRFHGIDREVFERARTGHVAHEVVSEGFKYNMTDIQASMGLWQLARSLEMRATRSAIVKRYRTELHGCMLPPTNSILMAQSHHLFIVRVPDRDGFIEAMKARGIACGVHYEPLHRHKYWREKYGLKASEFPNAEAARRNCVSLPLWSGMTAEQVDTVIDATKEVLCS